LETKSFPRLVSKEISEHHDQSGGTDVIVIDMPGLDAVSRSTESIMSELTDMLEGKDCTSLLLACETKRHPDRIRPVHIKDHRLSAWQKSLGQNVFTCSCVVTMQEVLKTFVAILLDISLSWKAMWKLLQKKIN